MEAGNRCKDEMPVRVDQSQNCDSISDANMAYDEYANRHLADIDSLKECIYVTACPMSEVLYNNLAEIEISGIHKCIGVEKDKYILLSALYLIVAHCLKGTSSLYHRLFVPGCVHSHLNRMTRGFG